ncbi:hypothetical protein BHE74_00033712 [Ensete ventricosum]|nr:hypothetical protein BHE74_00033712 [Ensete ventricosum]
MNCHSCSPRVIFCGYSIPHPSENKVNIRVQTTGTVCATSFSLWSTFGKAVDDFRANESPERMKIDTP